MTSKAKTETVQKSGDGWQFKHPVTNDWTGSFPSRDAARAARAALPKAKKQTTQTTEEDPFIKGIQEGTDALVATEKAVDNDQNAHVNSETSDATSEAASNTQPGDVAQTSEGMKNIMSSVNLSLDAKQRKSTSVVFKPANGVRGSIRIAKTMFPGGVAPSTLTLQSDQENAFATANSKMSADERKAARANAPKLTPAQKLQKLQERAAKLQAKIDAAAATTAQPTA